MSESAFAACPTSKKDTRPPSVDEATEPARGTMSTAHDLGTESEAEAESRKCEMTYMQKVHWTRAEICKIMDLQLRYPAFPAKVEHSLLFPAEQVTRKDELRMKWSTYWRDIVYEHAVAVEGWPDDIPFENLSSATSSLARLELLCVKWMVGTTRFRSVPLEELDLMGLAGKFDRTKPVRPPRADDGLIRGRRRDPEKRSKRLRPYYIKSRLVCHSES